MFTIIVVIHAPHTKGHTGGVAAAPVFKRIAEVALRYHGVAPNINPEPPILVTRHADDAHETTVSATGAAPARGQVATVRNRAPRPSIRTWPG